MQRQLLSPLLRMADVRIEGVDTEETPDSPQVKTLQYTRRGLKMVGEEKSLFDLEEPVWHQTKRYPRTLSIRKAWVGRGGQLYVASVVLWERKQKGKSSKNLSKL